jgi:hypothetical protein
VSRGHDGAYYFGRTGQTRLSTDLVSVFDSLGGAESTTAAAGWRINYQKLLGEKVDYVFERALAYSHSPALLERLRFQLYWAGMYTYLPIWRPLGLVHHADEYHIAVARELHRQALDTIAAGGTDIVAFFHYVPPHSPYIFDRQGVRTDYKQTQLPRAEAYKGNLEYLDTLIGEILAAVKGAGLWDAATVVFTSDHGMTHQGVSRHVPLFIKLPYQREEVRVKERFELSDLVAWLLEHRQRFQRDAVSRRAVSRRVNGPTSLALD